jgi:hypothetical protein
MGFILDMSLGEFRAAEGRGGGGIAPGPEALGAPRNLMLGHSDFIGRNISVFGLKTEIFGGKQKYFCYNFY